MSEWVAAGFPLWTRQYILLGCQIGSEDVATPLGTVDIIHSYWRILNPWRGAVSQTLDLEPTSIDASILVGGAPNADVTIPGPNPGIMVNFSGAQELDTIGVLWGGSTPVTTSLQVYTSPDSITWTLLKALDSATYTPGIWTYFDLNPPAMTQYVQVVYPTTGSWLINQMNFGLANGSDIMLGDLNIDDYYNLPNKKQQGDRAVSAFVDRKVNYPVLKIWQTLNPSGFYNGTVTALVRRYIQDPGSMTNAMELPQRGIEALIWRLAQRLVYELPERQDTQSANPITVMQKGQRIQMIEQNAMKAEMLFWAEERAHGPIRIMPNLRPYTR